MELDEPSGDNGVELIDATDPQDVIPNKCVSTPLLPAAEDFVEVPGHSRRPFRKIGRRHVLVDSMQKAAFHVT